ncbi:hypothetical protein GCM10027258_70690 [Amycolatopsis stemonae]
MCHTRATPAVTPETPWPRSRRGGLTAKRATDEVVAELSEICERLRGLLAWYGRE